jgi:hypothetical protein
MLNKCEPDSPDRCQAVHNGGQCIWKACEGSKYCEAHGGNKAIEAKEKESMRNYQLTKWQARIDQKKSTPDLKNLRDEIAILRMMLEERLNACSSGTDLMLHSSAISDLIMKVEKVVASCHKLDRSRGLMIDKQAILNFAGRVIQIITLELDGQPDKIDDIGNRILEEIGNIGDECID